MSDDRSAGVLPRRDVPLVAVLLAARRGPRSSRPLQMAHRTRPAVDHGREVHQLVVPPRWRRGHRLGDAPGGRGLPRGGDLAGAALRSRPGRRAPSTSATSGHTSLLCRAAPPVAVAGPQRSAAGPRAALSHRAPSSGSRLAASHSWSPANCTPTSAAMRSFSWWREKPIGRSAPSCVARDRASGVGWRRGRARTSATSGPAARGAQEIVLCESAIDAISCFQMHPERICISTSGVRANPPWLRGLIARGYHIHCGFDADQPGDAAAQPDDRPPSHRSTPPATRPRLERRPDLPLTSPSRRLTPRNRLHRSGSRTAPLKQATWKKE